MGFIKTSWAHPEKEHRNREMNEDGTENKGHRRYLGV